MRDDVLKEGFTVKSLIGILYVILILLPANIYYILTMGGSLSSAASIISLIFFIEIFKFSEKPLTKQEAFIIYSIASEAVTGSIAFALIGNMYFRSNPMAKYLGLYKVIPDWWAPPPYSPAIKHRIFFHHDWILPIFILFSAWTLGKIIDFSLGVYLYHQFIEIEKLPFPLANVSAETILSLVVPKSSKKRIFTATTILGIVYGILAYVIPLLTDHRILLIPIPFYDFTRLIEDFLPGASLGISTDLASYTFAFFMPHSFIVLLSISSIFIYLFANNLLVKRGLFPLYIKGMNLGEIYTWSYISFWINPTIGFGIAIALAQIFFYRKYIISTIREFTRKRTVGVEFVRSKYALYLFFASTIIASFLAWVLSGFNIFYLPLILSISVVWSFLFSHLQGRALAEYGFSFDIPYFVPVVMYLTGARDPKLWFTQTAGFTVYTGGVGIVQQLKVALLCETKPRSYIKAWFFAWFVGAIMGILYMQVFWKMAPIPSSAYPASMINFPVQVAEQYLLISAVTGVGGGNSILSLNIKDISIGFIAGIVVSVLAVILKLSPSLVGIALLAGTRTWISVAISFLISIVIARLTKKFMGDEWWNENRFVIVAGIYAGIGLAIGLGVIILFLKKALISPYYIPF